MINAVIFLVMLVVFVVLAVLEIYNKLPAEIQRERYRFEDPDYEDFEA